ncbi:hypothetical protein ACFVUS_28565 [Nocardia sp. NPDC058058]|uniref:hypothetical protein n=1 Tax=Nocardia sp. NPDC058058 TaxID=3346317 RepID=UPI0036D838D7
MRVRIQAGDQPMTVTFEIQGDERQLAAGDYMIVEYDGANGLTDDVHVEHSQEGIIVYMPSSRWRVWSSTGIEITP